MDTQDIRRTNLRRLLAELVAADARAPETQVAMLGNPVCPKRLTAMLNGSHIGSFFTRHVEHCLRLERGWMDVPHDAAPTHELEAS